MEIHNFEELKGMLVQNEKKVVVLAAAHDTHALEAVFKANEEGLIDYILVGNADKIKSIATDLNHALNLSGVIDEQENEACAKKAVELIRTGKGHILMKGKITTAELLKAVVNKEEGIRDAKVLSHVAIVESPSYHKLIAITDSGMLIAPDLEQKKEMLKNAFSLFRNMGYEKPKASILAAIETVNPKMQETVDAAALKEMSLNGEFGDCLVDGPVSFDLAVSKEAAEIKDFESEVTGNVDILMTPGIAAGNIVLKSMLYMGGAVMAGCIMGAKVPIVLTSRAASFEEKYNSIVLCAAMGK